MKSMDFLPDNLKRCGVKVKVIVAGVPVFGSGVVYVTPNNCKWDYVLTAKHLFQEDSQTPYELRKIYSVEVKYSFQDIFKRLVKFKKKELDDNLIVYEKDLVIITIPKRSDLFFPSILVSDKIGQTKEFFSWGTFAGNSSALHLFEFKRNDAEVRRFQTIKDFDPKFLAGLSGAGVFSADQAVLVGIISKYPNEAFQNQTIDCTLITIDEINEQLLFKGKVGLDIEGSSKKKIVGNEVVYIHQASINDAVLDLELARKRLEKDIEDDWFYDPLKYIDLLQPEYLFVQFRPYFGNRTYSASESERFYVPKKQYTLRQAMVSPFVDRIIYMACVSALAEKMDDAMISCVYSARYNKFSDSFLILKGVEQWKKMQYQLSKSCQEKDTAGNYVHNCVIEIDLLNFYDNIDKELLHEKIRRVCDTENEKAVANLLHDVIYGFSPRKSQGLPQNSDASSLLASFYLNQVDVFMSHHCPAYYRFMDDIRIFCKDKYQARKLLQTFEYELRRCHLSVNSQKTRILTLVTKRDSLPDDQQSRVKYDDEFDLLLNQVAAYRRSPNFIFRNSAFHLSVDILTEGVNDVDRNSSDNAAKKINFSLGTLYRLGQKGVSLTTDDSKLENALLRAIISLRDKPWITPQVCSALSLVPSSLFETKYFPDIKEILLNDQYNTYAFQTYLLWLLLAKHKINSTEVLEYAVRQIERNDETNKPVIAGMLIYVCSVNAEYRRIVIRKLEEQFTHGYFQNRIALITLRKFPADLLCRVTKHNSLGDAHDFTHKFKDRDLVFVPGFFEDDDEEEGEDEEQLYSI